MTYTADVNERLGAVRIYICSFMCIYGVCMEHTLFLCHTESVGIQYRFGCDGSGTLFS